MIVSHIKILMKEKKITMKRLEEMTGMSQATMNKARRDGSIAECRLSTLVRIADALGVNVNQLFSHVQDKKGGNDGRVS